MKLTRFFFWNSLNVPLAQLTEIFPDSNNCLMYFRTLCSSIDGRMRICCYIDETVKLGFSLPFCLFAADRCLRKLFIFELIVFVLQLSFSIACFFEITFGFLYTTICVSAVQIYDNMLCGGSHIQCCRILNQLP